ncbi:class I SAM-dependent methyltransferase [Sphingosinicella sp. LY1275]|uniref:class I SAM-dependent methyltransferase n=1 Tax=Sphingosinicella sp. LY1275 TaxID=3095379 RepID=UPI002ADEB1BB|nr:class I SAM-dependent methyltransferase [Sphingosinicella sp. LY1275]MEA1014303.1 class I SAM-dependent methyltransferase [Sphingosinicella sp. LY1275]
MVVFKDHFSSHSADYAAHRPAYPDALADYFAGLAPHRRLALDCGCGSGQLSRLLGDRFELVVATDASAAQIAKAEPHPRVEYRVAAAEESGLAEGSVALVTAAQAAHWFDLDAYYAEVRRVGRFGAVAAVISYGMAHIAPEIDRVVGRLHDETLAPFWPPERRHVEDGYRSLAFPFDEIEAPCFTIELEWRLAGMLAYLDTWSAVRRMEKAVGPGPFQAFAAELTAAWGDPAVVRRVTWPLALRVGRL